MVIEHRKDIFDLDLNQISLEQALIDFEIANARVIDLTSRLTTLSKEVLTLRGQIEVERTRSATLAQAASDRVLTNSGPTSEEVEALKTKATQMEYILEHLTQSRAVAIASLFASRLRSAIVQARAILR